MAVVYRCLQFTVPRAAEDCTVKSPSFGRHAALEAKFTATREVPHKSHRFLYLKNAALASNIGKAIVGAKQVG